MLDGPRFQQVWQELGSNTDSSDLLAQLLAAYQQPHRVYHTLAHLADCLHQFDLGRAEAEHPAEVEIALWFHDAVYELNASDNEAQSSSWAAQSLRQGGVSPGVIQRITAMILATKHDRPPESQDGALLLDLDLAILGQNPIQFAAYEQAIRQEYRDVPEAQYRMGRAAILERLLQRPAIYYTRWCRDRLEAQARHNLAQSIANLRGQLS